MSTFEEKSRLISAACLKEKDTDPIAIAIRLMSIPEISMHGPEHHMLDGAAFLTAYHNAGGKIDLANALASLYERALTMPGATCGYWGICGSSSSVGAALAIIHQTGPLSNNDYYKDNMELTSRCLAAIGKIGGPRCCKRNAYLSISTAASFVKEKYGISMPIKPFRCAFSPRNPTCLKEKCPFYPQ